MAFITELDVVNDMLGLLGETPLNTLDDEHPLVAAGRRFFRVARYKELAKGWWFNQEYVTLSPDANTGHITVPADTIRVDPVDPSLEYVQRGSRLYRTNVRVDEDPFVHDLKVECRLVREVAFEDLPLIAQNLISVHSQLLFQRAHDGDIQKRQDLLADYQKALMDMNAEHTRNKNANLLRNQSFLYKMSRIMPFRGPRLLVR